ncbi:hypothetical protein WDW86_00210 [Bdellovibrionota bacterium FG-2]
MLNRASIHEVKSGQISKAHGYLVIAMRVYPRFLPKELVDEYLHSLSPQADLFGRYREYKKKLKQQDLAFQMAQYEREFALSGKGLEDLERLAGMSLDQNVYLICQCERLECCHVDLMLLIGEKRFGARIGKLPHEYREFRQRPAQDDV